MLIVNGVGKSFNGPDGGPNLFSDISFSLEPGQFAVISGDSGCGKSTLLHMIGGIEPFDEGSISLEGVEICSLSGNARTKFFATEVGFIFQDDHLIGEFTATDNVGLPQRIAGMSKQKAKARSVELLSSLGLSKRLDLTTSFLSGGERQRVAIARALANGPKLILADEPTGRLHPDMKNEVYSDLVRLCRRENVCMVMVTHDMNLVERSQTELQPDVHMKLGSNIQ